MNHYGTDCHMHYQVYDEVSHEPSGIVDGQFHTRDQHRLPDFLLLFLQHRGRLSQVDDQQWEQINKFETITQKSV